MEANFFFPEILGKKGYSLPFGDSKIMKYLNSVNRHLISLFKKAIYVIVYKKHRVYLCIFFPLWPHALKSPVYFDQVCVFPTKLSWGSSQRDSVLDSFWIRRKASLHLSGKHLLPARWSVFLQSPLPLTLWLFWANRFSDLVALRNKKWPLWISSNS